MRHSTLLGRHRTVTRVSRCSASSFSSSSRPGGRSFGRPASGPAPSIDALGRSWSSAGGPRARRARRTASSTMRTDQPPATASRASCSWRLGRGCRAAPGHGRPTAALRQQLLDGGRELEQTQRVGDRRPALADPRGHLLLGQAEVLDQLLVGRRLFEGVEVLAVEVLDQRLLDRAARRRSSRTTAGMVGSPARWRPASAAPRR